MKQTVPTPSRGSLELASNSFAPVDQIWCVHQDNNASRTRVCDVLASNQIQVQRDVPEKANKAGTAAQEPVEAFYVAATPKQMKQAISQLSNSANIEMIQLPGGRDSLIADAIEQQFSQSNASFADADESEKSDIPAAFPTAASQALAQQLVSNALPRSMPPSGPVPPILKSGSPIAGLSQPNANANAETNATERQQGVEIAAKLRVQKQVQSPMPAAAAPGAAANKAAGGAGPGVLADVTSPSPAQTLEIQEAMPAVPERELGKYLDESDKQLRQYLILVSGGEEE